MGFMERLLKLDRKIAAYRFSFVADSFCDVVFSFDFSVLTPTQLSELR
jgi:hypothetical protein